MALYRSEPKRILMCHPKYFAVIDEKNEFMHGQIGKVNHDKAIQQWETLKSDIERLGTEVEVVEPLPGCEDMVFCANSALVVEPQKAIMSTMVHPSRQKETAAYKKWFEQAGYSFYARDFPAPFEGQGDALWHPGTNVLYVGYGTRTDRRSVEQIRTLLPGASIVAIPLGSTFYHLDTCFCPLDGSTAMYYPGAFTAEALAGIHSIYKDLIAVSSEDAYRFACNGIVLDKFVILQRGISQKLSDELCDRKFIPAEVDLSEFLKSGGSAACMALKIY